jgi:hypothetical protein
MVGSGEPCCSLLLTSVVAVGALLRDWGELEGLQKVNI